MTPSAYRLLGLIRERSASDSVYWIRLNLSEIAAWMKLSQRTLARAKAELDGYGLVKFRTISNGKGKGHKLHACLPHKLVGKRGELLHATKAGKERISRTKVGGEVINRPRPHDINIYKGTLRVHQNRKSTPADANLAKRKPTKKQIAFAHWLKRDLQERHLWDNCKINGSDAHAFGYALRALQAGFGVEQIHDAFENALKVMHGTATDVGLLTGQPTHIRFCLSSTVSLAQRMLKTWRLNRPDKQHWRDGKYMREQSYSYQQKGKPSWNGTAKNATSRPEMRHDRPPNKPQPCQRARFADIMDALV